MTILTHALIGAGLSINQGSLPAGFIISFVSHFFLDGIPHNDYIYFAFNTRNQKKAYASFLSLLILILSVFIIMILFLITKNIAVLTGAFAAVLPDLLSIYSNEIKIKPTLFDKFHFLLHTKFSLAEILLRRVGKASIETTTTTEEAERNYKIISGNTWGKIGWVTEFLLETLILILGLKMILA